VFTEQYNRGC